MLRDLHGCPVLRGRLVSGVAEALDAGRGGDKLVGKVVWARREGLKTMLRALGFTRTGTRSPGSLLELGGRSCFNKISWRECGVWCVRSQESGSRT